MTGRTTQACSPRFGSDALLELRQVGDKGQGVFAVSAFQPDDQVLLFRGEVRDVSTFADLTHALQIGPTSYISSSGQIDDFVNHSCSPNTGVRIEQGRVALFALKAIAAGDEITFDYSTTQEGQHMVIDCQCGTRDCRGRIGDFRDLPAELKNFYIAKGALLPFLLP